MTILIIAIFILTGAFSLFGSIFNWDFFFNSRKAQGLMRLIGRTGARVVYAILGIFVIGFGIAMALGILVY